MKNIELPTRLAIIDDDGRSTEMPIPNAMRLELAALTAIERLEKKFELATAFLLDAEAQLVSSADEAAGDIRRLQIQANFESAIISPRSIHNSLEQDVYPVLILVRKALNA